MRKTDSLRRHHDKRPLTGVRFRLFALLAIMGPGFTTATVDNDRGVILTCSQAGAGYSYMLHIQQMTVK